jgi:hypothetical protein
MTWGVFTGLSNGPQRLELKTGVAQKEDMGGLQWIIQQTPRVGTENRSGTKTGHVGSSQDYRKDPNSWNRKQERQKDRAWGGERR